MRLVYLLYYRTCFFPIRLPADSHGGAHLRPEQESLCPQHAERNQTIQAVQGSAAEYLDAVAPG
jgi:hypothetical protein